MNINKGFSAARRLARSTVWAAVFLLTATLFATPGQTAQLADTIEQLTPSVVGVGTYQPTRAPRVDFRGTGFILEDGRAVLTNRHVLPSELDRERHERLIVLAGEPGAPSMREAEVVAESPQHDLAVLRISGTPLPALTLASDSGHLRIGDPVAYTGFPIGMILGFYPATHTGIVSARTPLALPVRHGGELSPEQITRLRQATAPLAFQIDGTAYPGNSGSPVYDPATGEVYAVINRVFAQEGREAAMRQPSGISYAIPLDLAAPLLQEYRNRYR
ncbi:MULTISPECIES: S1C family serine protease [Halorhodospira]|uniref:S1C family serine protease n=1 Tax=Halorhodospira TaxID=85108 RepID=UPI001911BF37|nr:MULTISPECIES: serine protease [Halorhodospira]MBK5936596.1 serine protease [Halorhodospira halophila]MCG5537238.1 serine protease [Halorhodospira sp. 9622]